MIDCDGRLLGLRQYGVRNNLCALAKARSRDLVLSSEAEEIVFQRLIPRPRRLAQALRALPPSQPHRVDAKTIAGH
jgi:hypothetical protein